MPAIAKGPISHALFDESGKPTSFLAFSTGDFISDDDLAKLGGIRGPYRHSIVPIASGTSHENTSDVQVKDAAPAANVPAPQGSRVVGIAVGDTAAKTTEAVH